MAVGLIAIVQYLLASGWLGMCPSPWGLQVVHRPIVRGRFWECENLTVNEIVFMPQKYIDYCGPAQFLICQILTHIAPQWVLACFVLVVPKACIL